jgi:hypothetical protein
MLLTFSLFIALLMIGLTLNASENNGTMSYEGEEIGPEGVTDVYIVDTSGNPLSKMPKAKAFLIWVMWEPAVNQPQVTYIFNVEQDTTRTFTHIVVKKNTGSGIVGEACCQAIEPWANSGQTVTIIGAVKGVGTGTAKYTVE